MQKWVHPTESLWSKAKFYIYIYAFNRRFYPKRLHSSYSFYILSALAFPGNRTHDLSVASAMLYQLSYRKARNFWLQMSNLTRIQLQVSLIIHYTVDSWL